MAVKISLISVKHPVYLDDENTPVRGGGTRQRKKTGDEVFEMWLQNYTTDEIETNATNESSDDEEYRVDNLKGEAQA